jgi:hypothetical protein
MLARMTVPDYRVVRKKPTRPLQMEDLALCAVGITWPVFQIHIVTHSHIGGDNVCSREKDRRERLNRASEKNIW